MLFDQSQENLESLIAKSADMTNKPYLHSVVKVSGGYNLESEEVDLTVNILCRDINGIRLEKYDIELEIFKSNNEYVIVLSKLNFPDEPILWSGTKTLWMHSTSGKETNPPSYSFNLENLANRIRVFVN